MWTLRAAAKIYAEHPVETMLLLFYGIVWTVISPQPSPPPPPTPPPPKKKTKNTTRRKPSNPTHKTRPKGPAALILEACSGTALLPAVASRKPQGTKESEAVLPPPGARSPSTSSCSQPARHSQMPAPPGLSGLSSGCYLLSVSFPCTNTRCRDEVHQTKHARATHIPYTHIYIYRYIHVCVCVYICIYPCCMPACMRVCTVSVCVHMDECVDRGREGGRHGRTD